MPDFGNSGNHNNDTRSEDTTDVTQQEAEKKNDGNAQQNPFGGNGGMPDFGGNMQFPQGSGGGTQNNTLSIILLAVSALLLAGGLIFAFKFKR